MTYTILDKRDINIKILVSVQTLVVGHSLEASKEYTKHVLCLIGGSDVYLKHIFLCRNKKTCINMFV